MKEISTPRTPPKKEEVFVYESPRKITLEIIKQFAHSYANTPNTTTKEQGLIVN